MNRFRFYVLFGVLVFLPWLFMLDLFPAKIKPLIESDTRAAQFQNINKDWETLLEKEYETATGEIRGRISEEHLLYALKFLAVGAVLGLLATDLMDSKTGNGPYSTLKPLSRQALVFWSATFAASIVDARIHFNVQRIRELGAWLRQLEGFLLSRPALGWETSLLNSDFATSEILSRTHLLDRTLLTWIIYVITLIVCLPVSNKHESEVTPWMLPLSIALFAFVGSYFVWSRNNIVWYALMTIAAVGSSAVAHRWLIKKANL